MMDKVLKLIFTFFQAVVKKIGLSDFSATFFALFEVKENGFGEFILNLSLPLYQN